MRKLLVELIFVLYSYLLIPISLLVFNILSPFNNKIMDSLSGRRKTKALLSNYSFSKDKVVWIHCASLGEYEQAKPIIDKLKKDDGKIKIVLTFFSPSGFNSVEHENIDFKAYLPFDYPNSVKKFIRKINANILILAGYDVWPNFIRYTHQAKMPIFIISASLREGSHRLKPIISYWQKEIYSMIDKVLSVTEDDTERFIRLGVRRDAIKVLGNTRYDQVIERRGEAVPYESELSLLSKGKTVLVLGSIWKSDIAVILDPLLTALTLNPNLLVIFVPHDPDIKFVDQISSQLDRKMLKSVKYSTLEENQSEIRAIIVESIGHLAGLYKFADIAYLGGGFGSGVHNVMEPAVYGIPVIYGPKLKNSKTAQYLNEFGGGFIVKTADKFDAVLTELLQDNKLRADAGKSAYKIIIDHSGATEKTVREIEMMIK